jgi:hypothetical protein
MLTPEDLSQIELILIRTVDLRVPAIVEPIVERVVIKHFQPIREEIESLARLMGKGFARLEERFGVLELRVDKVEDDVDRLKELNVSER